MADRSSPARDRLGADISAIYAELKRPIAPDLVQYRQSGGGMVPYIEGFEAINTANEIFGYAAWGTEVVAWEWRERPGMYVATVRVTVAGWLSKTDVGTDVPRSDRPDAHEMALKGAITDGLKRALRQFGPRFGNDLYDRDGEYRTPPVTSGTPPARPVAAPASAPVGPPADPPPVLCPVHQLPTQKGMTGTLGHFSGPKTADGMRGPWCSLETAVDQALGELMATYSLTVEGIDALLKTKKPDAPRWRELNLPQQAQALPVLSQRAAASKRTAVEAGLGGSHLQVEAPR